MNKLNTIAILGIATLILTACRDKSASPSEGGSPTEGVFISIRQFAHEGMQIGSVQTLAFEQNITCNGSLQARPNAKALLNVPLPGIIRRIYCQNGQSVKSG